MSERDESIIRGQTLLMLTRNQGKAYINQRVIKRFLRCIFVMKEIQLKLFR